ncbi:PDE2A, partial [Cordylochernes scorpioides]
MLISKRKELMSKGTISKLRDNRLIVRGISYSVLNGRVVSSTGMYYSKLRIAFILYHVDAALIFLVPALQEVDRISLQLQTQNDVYTPPPSTHYKSFVESTTAEEEEEICGTVDAMVQTSLMFPQPEEPPSIHKEPCPEKLPKMPMHPPCRRFSLERAELEQRISLDFTRDEVQSFAYKLAFGKTCDVMRIHDDTQLDSMSMSRTSMPRGGRIKPLDKHPEPPRRFPDTKMGYTKICQMLKECTGKTDQTKTQSCNTFQVMKEYGKMVRDRNIKGRNQIVATKKPSMTCSGPMHQESQENMPHPCCCPLATPSKLPKKPPQESLLHSSMQQPLKSYVSQEEYIKLASEPIPPMDYFHREFDTFSFTPRSIPDNLTPLAVMFMFEDLGFISRFQLSKSTLAKFILMVKKGYRDPPYHNWYHAFSVAHFSYLLLKKLGIVDNYLSSLEAFALLVAGLCHDLDHRGTTNSFQVTTRSILATLYSSEGSVMERHHLAQAIAILNTDGCNIFETLSEQEYSICLDTLRDAILATDLAHHLRIIDQLNDMASQGYKKEKPEHHYLLVCMFISCSDLSDQTKDWKLSRKVADSTASHYPDNHETFRESFGALVNPIIQDLIASFDVTDLPDSIAIRHIHPCFVQCCSIFRSGTGQVFLVELLGIRCTVFHVER